MKGLTGMAKRISNMQQLSDNSITISTIQSITKDNMTISSQKRERQHISTAISCDKDMKGEYRIIGFIRFRI